MTIQRNESEVAMRRVSKFIQLISIAIHGDRKLTDELLKGMGLKLSDFQHEEKVLDHHDRKNEVTGEEEHVAEEKPLKKVFTSTEVDVLLDEIRQRKAKRMGLGQLRMNRGDTGDQVFGEDGLKNVVAPELASDLLGDGFALIEVQRERKPRRYTHGDVNKTRRWRQQRAWDKDEDEKICLPEEYLVKPVPTGENSKITKADLAKAVEAQLAYFSSIQEGKLKKSHPTVAKPTGTVQVWKYVVRATFLRSDEEGGAIEIARSFENNVLKKCVWENGHIWENPDGSVTINFTPQRGTRKILTKLSYETDSESFKARVCMNKDHKEFSTPNMVAYAGLVQLVKSEEIIEGGACSPDIVACAKLVQLVKKEQSRINRARDKAWQECTRRHEARRQAWRPAPGQRLSDALQTRRDSKNGDTPPPASN